MKLKLIFLFSTISLLASAQSYSYFGHQGRFNYQLSFFPSSISFGALFPSTPSDDWLVSYHEVGYERYISRKHTLILSSGFGRNEANLTNLSLDGPNDSRLIYTPNDPHVYYSNYRVSAGFRRYFQLSAPIGKYIGLQLAYNNQRATFNERDFSALDPNSGDRVYLGNGALKYRSSTYQVQFETGADYILSSRWTLGVGIKINVPLYPLDKDFDNSTLSDFANIIRFNQNQNMAVLIALNLGWIH